MGRIFGHPDNGLYKSIDGGDTWNQLGGGLPSSSLMGRSSVSVAPSQPDRLYALVTQPASATGGGASTEGAYRSDDGGASWTRLSNLGSIQSSFGWYLAVVGIDPSDADRVVFGGVSMRRSTNAGASFATITPPHVDTHAAVFDAAGRLIVGDDGGVHRSTNFGTSWAALNDGLGTVQFYAGLSLDPNDPDVVLGGTQDNGTNLRQAAGLGWTQVFGGDGGWTEIDPSNSNRLFCEFQGTGNLYLSTNGGASFNFTGNGISGSDRNAFLPPFLIDRTNPSRMLYGTHRIWRSTNGGATWAPASSDLTLGAGAIRALAQAPSDPQVVYAVTNDGNVQVSTDGGVNFQLVLTDHPGWPRVTRELTIHPSDPSTAYLAGSAFGVTQIQRTTDGGQSWLPFDANLPDVPVNVIAIEAASAGSPERVFAGADSGLFVTSDDGQSWRPFGIGLPNAPVIDLRLDLPRRRLVASTQGRRSLADRAGWGPSTCARAANAGSRGSRSQRIQARSAVPRRFWTFGPSAKSRASDEASGKTPPTFRAPSRRSAELGKRGASGGLRTDAARHADSWGGVHRRSEVPNVDPGVDSRIGSVRADRRRAADDPQRAIPAVAAAGSRLVLGSARSRPARVGPEGNRPEPPRRARPRWKWTLAGTRSDSVQPGRACARRRERDDPAFERRDQSRSERLLPRSAFLRRPVDRAADLQRHV